MIHDAVLDSISIFERLGGGLVVDHVIVLIDESCLCDNHKDSQGYHSRGQSRVSHDGGDVRKKRDCACVDWVSLWNDSIYILIICIISTMWQR